MKTIKPLLPQKKLPKKPVISDYPEVDLGDVHFVHLNALFTKMNNETFYRVYTRKHYKACYNEDKIPNVMYLDENDIFKLNVRKYTKIVFSNKSTIYGRCTSNYYVSIFVTSENAYRSLSRELFSISEDKLTIFKNTNSLDLRSENIFIGSASDKLLNLFNKFNNENSNIYKRKNGNSVYYAVSIQYKELSHQKLFSINKLGDELAMKLAKKHRDEFLLELSKKIFYTENPL